MRRLIYAGLLVGVLGGTGCGFFDWATTPDPATGETPAATAGKDIQKGGPYAFNDPVAWAALLFTVGKTGLRMWGSYQLSKKAPVA